MNSNILKTLDYQKSEYDLISEIFDLYIDYIQSLNLEDGLDLIILEYIKPLKNHWHQHQDLMQIIELAPEDPNTLEYHVFHALYSLIEDMNWSKTDTSISDISQEVNQVVESTTQSNMETREEKAHNLLLTKEQAKYVLLNRVYKVHEESISDISLLESKITFVQFHFADESNKIEILKSFTHDKQIGDFIIAAYEVMKKVLNFNISMKKTDCNKMRTAMGLNEFRTNGSHTVYGINLYDSNSVNNIREFACWIESKCSVKKNKVWLADKFEEMATSFNSLFILCHKLLGECKDKEFIDETSENFNQMYELIISFINFTSRKYKFNKKFKI